MEKQMPEALKARLEEILGVAGENWITPKGRSLRVNTIKAKLEEVERILEEKDFSPEKIPWTNTGYRVDNRPGLDDTIEYFLGHYYIQDAASMTPALVLEPASSDIVLDMTASPGSKTTQIAAMMDNKGAIVANENAPSRLGALKFNLSKYGVVNTVVTTMDAQRKWDCKTRFTKILLDAPCSCEGQVGNPEALEQWSLRKVEKCSQAQKKMLENAASLLAEEGALVYSTCTLAPEENEEVVDHILEREGSLKVEEIKIKGLKTHKGLAEWNGRKYAHDTEKTIRIHPKDNNTQGFYIAKLRKCQT